MPSLFNKKISQDAENELADLYKRWEPLAQELNELKTQESAIQDKIDLYVKDANSYDEVESRDILKPLQEQLDDVKNKIAANKNRSALDEIERQIKAIEMKEFGSDKLTPMYGLDDLKQHPFSHQDSKDLSAQTDEMKSSDYAGKELADLYKRREPLAQDLKELRTHESAIQDQIDFYVEDANSYDELELRDTLRPLEEQLDEVKNKIVTNKNRYALNEIEQQIKAIETKEFGSDKLTPMYELEALYLKRRPLLHFHNERVKEIMDLQAQIDEIKSFESSYDPAAYKTSITILENALKDLQKKLSENNDSKKLNVIDQNIIEKEIELYGEAKISSPSAALAYR